MKRVIQSFSQHFRTKIFAQLVLGLALWPSIGFAQEEMLNLDGLTSPDLFDSLTDFSEGPNSLAENGISLNADIVHFYMGVVEGGLDQSSRDAGHADYLMNVDFNKLGGPQGLFLKIRAEHHYGESMAGTTGAILPSNTPADLPVADSEHLYITNFLFTQMFSETFGVFAGKLDTLDGDINQFAHGRGTKQFSNMAFVANPLGLRTIVYSTLGAGFVILHEGEPLFTMSVLNPTDTVRTIGFDELFEEGVVLAPELRIPTKFFNLPGHQLFSGSWSSRSYTSLGQDPRIILPEVPIAEQSESWSLFWNFDQHLYVDPCNPNRGWGIFGRAGIADDETNPIKAFYSFGFGGSSMLRGRDADTFGIGWYYAQTSDELGPLLSTVAGSVGDGQGIEMYYDVAVTENFHLTPDVQVIGSSRKEIDTAVLLGVRARLSF